MNTKVRGTVSPPFIQWIGRIRKALRREFESRAAEFDITAAQFQILKRLWEGDGVATSVLVRDVASDGGTITGLLDRLEVKELIRRERSTEDRRSVNIFLTRQGRALEAPLRSILAELNANALAGFTPAEVEAMVAVLQRVGENLDA